MIAESKHAQCDVDRNEYLLLKMFINHRKDGSALSGEDQKIVVKGQETLKSQQLVGVYIASGRQLHIMGEVI